MIHKQPSFGLYFSLSLEMSKPNLPEGATPVVATTTTTTTVVTDSQSSHEAQSYGLDAIERRRIALQEVFSLLLSLFLMLMISLLLV